MAPKTFSAKNVALQLFCCAYLVCFGLGTVNQSCAGSQKSCVNVPGGDNFEGLEADAVSDVSVLMQTAHMVEMQLRSEPSHVSHNREVQSEPLDEPSYLPPMCTGDYLTDLITQDTRLHVTSIPSIADFTIRRDCTPDPPLSLLKRPATIEPGSPWPARIVVSVYIGFVIIFVLYLSFTGLTKSSDTKTWVEEAAKTRPEQVVYNRNPIFWVLMSWVDPWIAHWGNPQKDEDLKIPSSLLGGLGWKEDESAVAQKRLEELWDEQSKVGSNIDLLWVILRFVTYRKLAVMALLVCTYQGILFLGPAWAIRQIVPMLKVIHFRYQADPALVTTADCLWPSLHVIALFTGGGMLMFISDTIAYIMLSKVNVTIRGGLNAMCFSKAQRLRGNNVDFDVPAVGGWAPQKYSFVTLVNTDINSGMNGIFMGVFNIIFFFPMTAILCYMLAVAVKAVAVITLITQVVLLGLVLFSCVVIANRTFAAGILMHARVTHCQEFFQGIRIIKSYAWEEATYKTLSEIRRNEVEALRANYRWSAFFYVLTFFNPRLLFFVTLLCTVWIYGDIDAITIFTLMQLLRAFNNAQREITNTIPNVTRIYPSFVRLQCFLRLPDCKRPSRAGRALVDSQPPPQLMPAWADPEASGRQRKIAAKMKGCFSWRSDLPATLKDIDLEIYEGELVGIVGEVGSGKTALLCTLLSELIPCEDAIVEVPDLIAYHAQVPLISEGNLRDNVIFWREADEERYEQVLHDSCLLGDLEFLPGSDQCSIGHKGIALSGGQRARVSLARMAYTKNSDLMVIDDPFSSVDMQTADHLLKNLLLGELLKKKTRVVVTQPDPERLQHFDRVIVMAKGEIVAQGLPKDMVKVQAFQDLQKEEEDNGTVLTATKGQADGSKSRDGNAKKLATLKSKAEEVQQIRDEEVEGRANWATISFFFNIGGWGNAVLATVFYGLMVYASLLSDVTLAQWGSAELHGVHRPGTFLAGYSFWGVVGLLLFFPLWYGLQSWSMNVSAQIFDIVAKNLLGAPVDKFHDRHPLGRILNRLSTDLMQIDYVTIYRLVATMGMFWNFGVPLVYMHFCLPFWVTLAAIPFYFLVVTILRRYWYLMVALRYLSATTRSKLSAYVGDTGSMRSTLRAYGVVGALEKESSVASDHIISADYATAISRKWVIFRWGLSYIFVLTLLVLLSIWFPGAVSVGTTSLIISIVVGFVVEIEYSLEMATGVQYELINMNRMHEYTDLPQEAASRMDNDSQYSACFVKLKRAELGSLTALRQTKDIISITRDGRILLQETDDGKGFRLGAGRSWKEVSSVEHQELEECQHWHRLVAAGFEGRDPESMARILCNGKEPEVTLCIQSNWLAKGAHIKVTKLQAGYSKFPNTLHDITLDIAPYSKVAIMGPTGCGKSTFLQCLLRILEPRSAPGSIKVNDVDTAKIGLTTLRTMFGLVPQDPILFSGPLRSNLDPFEQHSDDRVWNALSQVKLANQLVSMAFPALKEIEKGKEVAQMRACLALGVRADGDNFSFGQRQLLCIARMILRQPAVLLLDECTSAIDPRTQQLVQESIRTGFPHSTTIAIAHRLETIMDFDVAAVFHQGRVKKTGCPRDYKGADELLEWALLNAPGSDNQDKLESVISSEKLSEESPQVPSQKPSEENLAVSSQQPSEEPAEKPSEEPSEKPSK